MKFGIAEVIWDFLVFLPHTDKQSLLQNPMANVFGILTAIVLALSAFIAYKNKAAHAVKTAELATATQDLATNTARLEAVKGTLAELPEQISGVEGEVATLTTAESAQQSKNEEVKGQLDTKTAKIAENKGKLDEIREKTQAVGNIEQLASVMRTTSAELEELTQNIDTANAKLANLTSQNTAAEGQVSTAKTRFENYTNGQSLPALSTRIRTIYPNWGFVTLAAGNNAGVVTNSTLDVVRGGETVAKLLVTAVESNSASATIVPDSLGSDVTLSVGDRVIPGTKAAAPKSGN